MSAAHAPIVGSNPFVPAARPLQLAPRAGSNPEFSLNLIRFVTATVHTVSGSVYVVVARKGFVSMTLASVEGERYSWQPQAGESYVGAHLEHFDGRLFLMGRDGQRILATTTIETIDVHEN